MGMGTHRLIYSWEWELENVPKSAALDSNCPKAATPVNRSCMIACAEAVVSFIS
jgi:hypothetical protein